MSQAHRFPEGGKELIVQAEIVRCYVFKENTIQLENSIDPDR